MSKHRYYYYDQETCSFQEVEPEPRRRLAQWGGGALAALVMAVGFMWAIDHFAATPEELALRAENEALQTQLATVSDRMDKVQNQLATLSEADQSLYRTLLRAEPISEDVRQVGVGGTDTGEEFDRYRGEVSSLLRTSATQLEEIERQIALQNASYRNLNALARNRDEWVSQLPVLLPANGKIVSGYGLRRHPILKVRRMHHGLDFLVRTGTPIMAPGDGIVKRTGRGPGYGIFVEIEHPETGYSTFYAHLSKIPDRIRKGVEVKRNELIAYSGNTGRSTGPHLHYEVRKDGRSVNPAHLFAPSMTPKKYKEMLAQVDDSDSSLDY